VRAARDLDRDTLDRRRRVLGQDHPDTVTSASNLAADLRALGEADDNPLKPLPRPRQSSRHAGGKHGDDVVPLGHERAHRTFALRRRPSRPTPGAPQGQPRHPGTTTRPVSPSGSSSSSMPLGGSAPSPPFGRDLAWLAPLLDHCRYGGPGRPGIGRYLESEPGCLPCSRRGCFVRCSCLVDALPEELLRRRPRANPFVAAVFRIKWLLRERCSATCQRRRPPGQARHRREGFR
jgi:hypothetical protein